ncbi:MAG TPA: hypothetical protein VMN36_13305 [Verrucomicrobiales bacterium]|nr:hypothetical protein [Verrucomicrobiales bacterium]
MGNPSTADGLIRLLAARFRVITLGGVAVISHGLGRNTHDADVWVEPLESPVDWAAEVGGVVFASRSARPVRIGTCAPFPAEDLANVIGDDKVFRVMGLDRPLDIFREPNELEIAEFDEVWERAVALDDGTRVPDAIDLLVTKQATDRDKDMQDIAFLEAKAEREYLARLPSAGAEEAAFMLGRFLTPKVAELGLRHPEESVRKLSLGYLKELAAEGDPFAREILDRV